MVWDLLRTKKEKPAAGKTGYWRTFWRRRWDSNPRTLADQTISSRSRYDHFDTSPYLSQHQHLRKRGELMGRTKKNIQLKIPEKPRKIKGFRSGSYRIATTISSRSRYDRFDSPPYISTVFCALRKCKKNRQERYEILKFDPAKTLINQGFSAEKTARASAHFESFSL